MSQKTSNLLQNAKDDSTGKSFSSSSTGNSSATETPQWTSGLNADSPPNSELRQPAWHVLVLCSCTFMIYQLFWFHKTWKLLCDNSVETTDFNVPIWTKFLPQHMASANNASPFWRTLGLCVPHWRNYIFFTLVLAIAKRVPGQGNFVAQHPVIASLGITIAFTALAYLAQLKGAAFMLFLLAAVPVAIAQHWLNRHWDTMENSGKIMRHGFNALELTAIIIGALLLGGLGASFILGAN